MLLPWWRNCWSIMMSSFNKFFASRRLPFSLIGMRDKTLDAGTPPHPSIQVHQRNTGEDYGDGATTHNTSPPTRNIRRGARNSDNVAGNDDHTALRHGNTEYHQEKKEWQQQQHCVPSSSCTFSAHGQHHQQQWDTFHHGYTDFLPFLERNKRSGDQY